MKRRRTTPGRDQERGVIILLVALVLLFIVTAFAALAIDLVTLYTARSEAQLAADSAALAGARALANSGMTSDPTDLIIPAENLARSIALEEALQNKVGGRYLNPGAGEVVVNFNDTDPNFGSNPHVIVHVTRADLPTFFARIWGRTQITVSASATAEAYNPSDHVNITTGSAPPVAPSCVKPWLLPNMDPSGGTTIFDPTTGAITNTSLLGWSPSSPTAKPMSLACSGGDCTLPLPPPKAWQYYPGDDATTFPHPTHSLPTCSPALISNYQESIAGCIDIPIACNRMANIDTSNYPARNSETTDAVNCLTHATNSLGDTVTSTAPPSAPFQFVAGADNPVAGIAGSKVMVSSSLVTVPVFDSTSGASPSVQIVGFVQLFLNPDGGVTPGAGNVNTTVVNLVGCGPDMTGQPILGNGASPVAVRLISR